MSMYLFKESNISYEKRYVYVYVCGTKGNVLQQIVYKTFTHQTKRYKSPLCLNINSDWTQYKQLNIYFQLLDNAIFVQVVGKYYRQRALNWLTSWGRGVFCNAMFYMQQNTVPHNHASGKVTFLHPLKMLFSNNSYILCTKRYIMSSNSKKNHLLK